MGVYKRDSEWAFKQQGLQRSKKGMKKFMGINRNKYGQFEVAKLNGLKKRHRFKIAGKDDEDIITQTPMSNNALITNTTQNSSHQESQSSKTLEIYEYAKQNISQANQIKKEIIAECKRRITIFKESEAKRFDENICRLSKRAIEFLLKAEKSLGTLRTLKGASEYEEKYIRNMEKSLAQELRTCSRDLRAHEKDHFDMIKSYESGTTNSAIELSETQKERMRGDFDQGEESSIAMIEEVENSRNSQINELVSSINKLSSIYKELNELVIEQGSLIDRIDCNIEETLDHVDKGTQHLKKADEHASNSCAEKCMLVLLALILVLAIILGLKYSS